MTVKNRKEMIKNKIEQLLSKEFYCSPKELKGNSTAYSVLLSQGIDKRIAGTKYHSILFRIRNEYWFADGGK